MLGSTRVVSRRVRQIVFLPVFFALFLFSVSSDHAGAQSQDSVDLAQQMFVAYYGRPGDPGGVNFWAGRFDQSPALGSVLAAFGTSLEYEESFGSLTNSQLVSGLYDQMFTRSPDPGGLVFYVDRLERGVATLASIAKQIADGASGDDLVTLNNKILVANEFTNHVATQGVSYQAGDIPAVRSLLASVTSSAASVGAALEAVSRFGIATPESKTDISPILNLLLGP